MNVTIVRLGPVTKQIAKLAAAVERLAYAYEMDLADRGLHVRPPKADTSGAEPETLYVDEEMDALRESIEEQGQMTPEMRRMFYGQETDAQ